MIEQENNVISYAIFTYGYLSFTYSNHLYFSESWDMKCCYTLNAFAPNLMFLCVILGGEKLFLSYQNEEIFVPEHPWKSIFCIRRNSDLAEFLI